MAKNDKIGSYKHIAYESQKYFMETSTKRLPSKSFCLKEKATSRSSPKEKPYICSSIKKSRSRRQKKKISSERKVESPESEREKPRSGRIAKRRNGGMDGAKRREKGESDVRFELAPRAHEPLVPPSFLLKVTHT